MATKTKSSTGAVATLEAKIAALTPEKVAEIKKMPLDEAKELVQRAIAAFKAELTLHKTYGIGSGFRDKRGNPAEVDIVLGSRTAGENVPVVREDGSPKFANKMCVQIRCAHPGCKETRWVATSDLQNVARCEEHQKEHLKQFRSKTKSKRTNATAQLNAAAALDDLLNMVG